MCGLLSWADGRLLLNQRTAAAAVLKAYRSRTEFVRIRTLDPREDYPVLSADTVNDAGQPDSVLGQESRFWSAQIKAGPLLVRCRTS